MPRSSRHKSSHHKSHQHKRNSKDLDSEEDEEQVLSFKEKNNVKEKTISSRDSEKRKLAGGGGGGGGGGDLVGGEYNGSSYKRRKEKGGSDGPASDRWNGGEVVVVSKEKAVPDLVDLKSKSSSSSRRHEERKSEVVVENEEVVVVKKSVVSSNGKVDVKASRSDKDASSKKEVHYKEKETIKDKEYRSSEREKKNQDVRREMEIDSGTKIDVVNAERQKHDELRNPELERELEKRIRRRRDDSDDKDKYHDDSRDAKDSRLSARDDRTRSSRYKDEKQQDDRYRESHHDDPRKDRQKDDKYRESHHDDLRKDRQKDERYRERHHDDLRQEKPKDDKFRESHHDDHRKDRQKDDRYRESRHEDSRKDHTNRDDKRSYDYFKDHSGQRSDAKYPRDEKRSPHEKSKPQEREREGDGSPRNDDRLTIYKDGGGKKRYADDNDEYGDLKSRNTKEHHAIAEKKTPSSSRKESPADRGLSQSRHTDYDSTVNRSRRRSASPSAHPVKAQFRSSSKAESQYREPLLEERLRPNVTPSRERTSVHGVSERVPDHRSTTKPPKEEGNNLANYSAERSPVRDRQTSPAHLTDKPQSSTSYEKRYSNRANVNRSLDMEETGRRDDRGSRELPLEKPATDEFRQTDGDTVSVSSSFNRNNHFPSNSSSIPTTPSFRGGASNFGSSEEDGRGKSNRYRRPGGDFSVGRGPGNAWKGGVPNWPSPLPNNFMPFQHGPPAGGFHAMMQQFPAPPMFGNHPGIPYHMPDADRFAVQMHGWNGNSNGVFGYESPMYGRPDWDQNRHMQTGRGWDGSSDMWKGQKNVVAPEKDDHGPSPTDAVWAGHPSQRPRNERNRPNFRTESTEVKRSEETPPAPVVPIEAPPVKQILEKTPEPVKASPDSYAHICHAYLSKLDISEDLTHPKLYEHCMSLSEIGANPLSEYGSKHAHLKEFEESRLKLSNTTLDASFFPILKDTVLQRAMLLYRKRGEETQTKLPLSSLAGPDPDSAPSCTPDKAEIYPSLSEQKQESLSITADQSIQVDQPSAQEMAKEPTAAEIVADEKSPAAEMRIEEPVPVEMMIRESVSVEMMVEEPIAEVMSEQPLEMAVDEPVPAQLPDEEPVPAQMMVDEPVPAQTMVEEPIPAQMMVEEPVSANMVEEPVSAQMLVEESGPARVDDLVPATEHEDLGEPDLNSDQKKPEVLDLIPDGGGEPVLDSDQEKSLNLVPNSYQELKEPIAYQSEVVDLVTEEDAIVILSDSEGDGDTTGTDATHSKSVDPLGYTNEVCEALTPESIECGSVSLSRIHSSKSTH